jgi:hypothetical protein
MKLTFTDLQTICKEISGVTDMGSVLRFRRDINTGATRFLAKLGREYNRKSRYTDVKANQQYYQIMEDGHKLKEIIVSNSGWANPLEQVADEHAWREMNAISIAGTPTHYFIKGYDEVGLYPTPSYTLTNGIELVYSPRHVEMTQEDYLTGTISVTNGSQTIVGTGVTFTANMKGQWFQTTDGTDENWYRISAFVDAATLTLENYYLGTTGNTKAYRIGQVADLPEEYLEALSDFAMYKHYTRRGSQKSRYSVGHAGEFKALFDDAVENARNDYGQMTDNQVIIAGTEYRIYNPFRGDPPPNGISA